MNLTTRGAWDVISTTVVAVAAVTMLVFYLHDRTLRKVAAEPEPTFVDDWRDWGESGIRIGAGGATMTVATFTDFTCPFCRDLVPVIDSLAAEYPEDVAIEHHHYPLNMHEFAVPGAIAAECAHRQDKFAQMYHTLFFQMDSIGSKAWEGFAKDAGLPDLLGFEQCIQSPPEAFPRIAAGRALGARIGVTGTPSVWVNGEFFYGRTLEAFRERARKLGL